MEKHFILTDTEFENQFASGKLDVSLFTHEAHLRLAWIHIQKYGLEKATKTVQLQLKDFVEFVGARDKYNCTLTVAAIKAVYHFMQKTKASNFKDFIEEFPKLKYNFKELMDFHYGFDIFNSEKAKINFLEPDLLPFD